MLQVACELACVRPGALNRGRGWGETGTHAGKGWTRRLRGLPALPLAVFCLSLFRSRDKVPVKFGAPGEEMRVWRA